MKHRRISTPRIATAVALAALMAAPAPAAVTVGNSNYQVTVEEQAGVEGIGVYTATTDILHPVTAAYGPQNVLFGGNSPSTSWTAIHSYTSDTTYTQRRNQTLQGGAPVPLILEDYVVSGQEAAPVAGGFSTHYMIQNAGSGGGPNDDLDVFQTVRAVGTNFNDSAVELTTEVFNISNHDIEIGIRYLLDFQIGGGEDGPSFQLLSPNGNVEVLEQAIPVPAALQFEIGDNNDPNDVLCTFGPFNIPFPFFAVGGSVRGPSRFQPTAPTELQFVAWPLISGLPGKFAFFAAPDAFFYTIGPQDAASCVISYDDSGVQYYWGETQGSSFHLAPGQGAKVSAFLFAYLPGQPPAFPPPVEDCNDGVDNDGDGLVDAQDPDCKPLVVDLAAFETRQARRGIDLTWSTASEIDNAGFIVLRGETPSGPFHPVSGSLIPGKGSQTTGATYTFNDRGVRRKKLYYYVLVDVDLNGERTEHGPLAASAGDPKPDRRRRR